VKIVGCGVEAEDGFGCWLVMEYWRRTVGVFEARVVTLDHTLGCRITRVHGRAFQINNRATARFGRQPSEPIAAAAAFTCKFEVPVASQIAFDVPALLWSALFV
jgi:hypothetical protein